MRIYRTFVEAIGEIKRDLKEMGIRVENVMMQDKVGSFPTLELPNYAYMVLEPNVLDLAYHQLWVANEWHERLEGILGRPQNPGTAWTHRADQYINWQDYLEQPTGRFAYTYSDRFALNHQVAHVAQELSRNPTSRQLYISLWDPDVDSERLGQRRVPCSIGWHFMKRLGRVHITYTMRSCDFLTHMQNDLALTIRLWHWVCLQAKEQPGTLTHFINSLHVYEKDVADVF